MFSQDDLPLERLVKGQYTTVKEKFKLDGNCAINYTTPKQGKLQKWSLVQLGFESCQG